MSKRIVKLSREPFAIDLEKGGGWYLVDSRTGDVKFGCAVFHADNGWRFSLTPGAKGQVLKLHSSEAGFEIGWTEDGDAADWVDAVNRFLESKRRPADENGKPTLKVRSGSAVG